MLRSYGRLISSLSVRNLRYASTAVSAQVVDPSTDTTLDTTKKPRQPRNRVQVINDEGKARGLSDIQASLEALGYGQRRRSRGKRKPTSDATTEPTTLEEALRATSPPKTIPRRKKQLEELPPRLLPPISQKHHDLASFLAYADRTAMNTTSTVYRGTHFEYTVADTLRTFSFTLHRTGRSNDLGIDLMGHWTLPVQEHGRTIPVLIQCKAAKTTPAMVRELEGAYVGAPAGWRGDGVLGVLVSTQAATKGVSAAIQRSRWPLGMMQITREGEMKQFIWNAVAAQIGLDGLGVAVRYASKPSEDGESGAGVEQSISLTWIGKPWRPAEEKAGIDEITVVDTLSMIPTEQVQQAAA